MEESRQQRIVGGAVVSPRYSIPWQVYIAPKGRKSACGGTLISYRHVLTAAHCTDNWFGGRFREKFYFVVGEHSITSSSDGTRYRVCNFVNHPSYVNKEHTEGYIDYDLSILHLKRRVKFGPRVRPAYLPPYHFGNDFLAGKILTVSGWGRLHAGQEEMPDVLYSVKVTGIRHSQCKRDYGSAKIRSGMLCAGRPSGGVDACKGDGGGMFYHLILSKCCIFQIQNQNMHIHFILCRLQSF